MRADFVEVALMRTAIFLPELVEALGERFSKDVADGDAGDEVTFFRDDRFLGAGVVAVFRVIEALGHIILKGDGAVFGDFFEDDLA